MYTLYSLLEKLIEVPFKDLFKLILACSRSDISLRSDFASFLVVFIRLQFNGLAENFLLAVLCGLSDLSDAVCLGEKMHLQDAQWHHVGYFSIPSTECNWLLMITICRQSNFWKKEDVKRCCNLPNISVKIPVSSKAISFIIRGLRSLLNRTKF